MLYTPTTYQNKFLSLCAFNISRLFFLITAGVNYIGCHYQPYDVIILYFRLVLLPSRYIYIPNIAYSTQHVVKTYDMSRQWQNHITVYIIQVLSMTSIKHAYPTGSKISIRIQIGQWPTYWIIFIHTKNHNILKKKNMHGFYLAKRFKHVHSIACIISMFSPGVIMPNYLRTVGVKVSHYSI